MSAMTTCLARYAGTNKDGSPNKQRTAKEASKVASKTPEADSPDASIAEADSEFPKTSDQRAGGPAG